ncbi:DUF2919 domain-containing protein [Glaciecola sp. MH2013]|uniref:DUF2919 domain-containing protein n=1 Tax=Glaciecola sp. MH2013 TaxID=2785524 RepID=UPI001E61D71A|nr:DUF2919 domain-containing protein [Glaciecola sp. MH2013]
MSLPLHCYDDNGRIKPPLLLMFALIFFARSVVVFIASLSFRQDGSLLLSIFYPDKYQFYLTLLGSLLSVSVLFLIGFREKIWKTGRARVFVALPVLLAIICAFDLGLQLYIIAQQGYLFSWPMATIFLITLLIIWYLLLSKHLREILRDWQASV